MCVEGMFRGKELSIAESSRLVISCKTRIAFLFLWLRGSSLWVFVLFFFVFFLLFLCSLCCCATASKARGFLLFLIALGLGWSIRDVQKNAGTAAKTKKEQRWRWRRQCSGGSSSGIVVMATCLWPRDIHGREEEEEKEVETSKCGEGEEVRKYHLDGWVYLTYLPTYLTLCTFHSSHVLL